MAEDRLRLDDEAQDEQLHEELSELFFKLRIRFMLLGLPLLCELMVCKEMFIGLARQTPLALLPVLLLAAVALMLPQFVVLNWILRRWDVRELQKITARREAEVEDDSTRVVD